MKKYNRVMAGSKSAHAEMCFDEGFIGVDFDINVDLTGRVPEKWREFNKEFIPIFLAKNPGKSKIAAGLACGMTWKVSKDLKEGDIVITPDGNGRYRAGEITGPYVYAAGKPLFHRRPVNWFPNLFDRTDMSQALQNSSGSIGTTCDLTKYAEELDRLIDGQIAPTLISTDETVEGSSVFALEKHLEDFLIANWSSTELGLNYNIFEVDGELVGQQFPSDTGPMDILAISKDKKELLIVELKKGRASDSVIGQIQRYMGYAQEELAEEGQTVKGVIIALDEDLRIRRALKVTRGIEFYRYQVSFKLLKQDA
jgi:restriction system protein